MAILRVVRLSPALLLLAVACDPAGQTPNPGASTATVPNPSQPGSNGNSPAPGDKDKVTVPYCKDQPQVLAGLDAAVGDLKLRDLVNAASGTFPGVWKGGSSTYAQAPALPKVSPNLSGVPGNVTVSYQQGQIRFIKSEFVDCTPGVACAEIGVTCVDRIEVDMQLAVNSQGGALAERWVGTLSVLDTRDPDLRDPDSGEKERPRSTYEIQGKIEPLAFQGTAKVELQLSPKFELRKHRLTYSLNYKNNALQTLTVGHQMELKEKRDSPDSAVVFSALPIFSFTPNPK